MTGVQTCAPSDLVIVYDAKGEGSSLYEGGRIFLPGDRRSLSYHNPGSIGAVGEDEAEVPVISSGLRTELGDEERNMSE